MSDETHTPVITDRRIKVDVDAPLPERNEAAEFELDARLRADAQTSPEEAEIEHERQIAEVEAAEAQAGIIRSLPVGEGIAFNPQKPEFVIGPIQGAAGEPYVLLTLLTGSCPSGIPFLFTRDDALRLASGLRKVAQRGPSIILPPPQGLELVRG